MAVDGKAESETNSAHEYETSSDYDRNFKFDHIHLEF